MGDSVVAASKYDRRGAIGNGIVGGKMIYAEARRIENPQLNTDEHMMSPIHHGHTKISIRVHRLLSAFIHFSILVACPRFRLRTLSVPHGEGDGFPMREKSADNRQVAPT
jgi:hypothetical protein